MENQKVWFLPVPLVIGQADGRGWESTASVLGLGSVHPVRGGPEISSKSRIWNCVSYLLRLPRRAAMGSLLQGDRVESTPCTYRWFTNSRILYTCSLCHLMIYPRTPSKSLYKNFIRLYISYGSTMIYLVVFYLCYILHFSPPKCCSK